MRLWEVDPDFEPPDRVPSPTFDGNHTDDTGWLLVTDEINTDIGRVIREATINGCLDWVLIPTNGYRI